MALFSEASWYCFMTIVTVLGYIVYCIVNYHSWISCCTRTNLFFLVLVALCLGLGLEGQCLGLGHDSYCLVNITAYLACGDCYSTSSLGVMGEKPKKCSGVLFFIFGVPYRMITAIENRPDANLLVFRYVCGRQRLALELGNLDYLHILKLARNILWKFNTSSTSCFEVIVFGLKIFSSRYRYLPLVTTSYTTTMVTRIRLDAHEVWENRFSV